MLRIIKRVLKPYTAVFVYTTFPCHFNGTLLYALIPAFVFRILSFAAILHPHSFLLNFDENHRWNQPLWPREEEGEVKEKSRGKYLTVEKRENNRLPPFV